MREIGFADAFTFIFSPRDGTPATRMPPELAIPEEVASDRLQRLLSVVRGIARERNLGLLGTRHEVLVEKQAKRGADLLQTRTRDFKTVLVPGDESMLGRYLTIEITGPPGPPYWSAGARTSTAAHGRLTQVPQRAESSRGRPMTTAFCVCGMGVRRCNDAELTARPSQRGRCRLLRRRSSPAFTRQRHSRLALSRWALPTVLGSLDCRCRLRPRRRERAVTAHATEIRDDRGTEQWWCVAIVDRLDEAAALWRIRPCRFADAGARRACELRGARRWRGGESIWVTGRSVASTAGVTIVGATIRPLRRAGILRRTRTRAAAVIVGRSADAPLARALLVADTSR